MSDKAKDLTKTNNVIKAPKKTTAPKKIIESPTPTGGASITQNDFSVLSYIGVTKNQDIVLTPMLKGEQEDLTGDNSKKGISDNKNPKIPDGNPTNITSPIRQPKNPISTSSIGSAIDSIESNKPKRESFNYDNQQIELSDRSEINRDFTREDSGLFGDIFSGGSKGSSGGSSGGGQEKSGESKDFFTSFGAEFQTRLDGNKSPTKKPQEPSNDPNLEDPKPIKTPEEAAKEAVKNAPILDPKVEKFILNNSARSLFRKSYSVFNQLTPFIKCFIRTGKDDSSKKFDVNLLDIPYNFIKSLEVTYETSGSVNGIINLKLEDAGGSVGLFLMSKLWSLGLTSGNMNGVPKIIIQFGWAPNGRQKIKKKYKNIYKQLFY